MALTLTLNHCVYEEFVELRDKKEMNLLTFQPKPVLNEIILPIFHIFLRDFNDNVIIVIFGSNKLLLVI